MTAAPLAGRRVTVMGLGRFGGGVGVARWLCAQGAAVTVSDMAAEDRLADSVRQLAGCDLALHLGGHDPADIRDTDLLVVNPAVPPDHPLLREAATVPQTTAINLFLERCPAPVVAITGSAGKSTTTAMTGAILSENRTVHVGGNIGVSLLETLPVIADDHVVVMELSSFQLERLPAIGISPHVAVVTNIRPNHLDRHGTMERYIDAKKNIFRFQGPGDVLVLCGSDPALADWAPAAPGTVAFFYPPGDDHFSEDDRFELAVPGDHNQANAQAACAAAQQLGVSRDAAARALAEFGGLPHRLQQVARIAGVTYVDDSNCTAPDEALVALETFAARSPVILLGGHDKGIDFAPLAAAVTHTATAAVVFGAAADTIREAIAAARGDREKPAIIPAAGLAEAVEAAAATARPGDTVLLSPACASYDEFDNYRARGERFVELVKAMGSDHGN